LYRLNNRKGGQACREASSQQREQRLEFDWLKIANTGESRQLVIAPSLNRIGLRI